MSQGEESGKQARQEGLVVAEIESMLKRPWKVQAVYGIILLFPSFIWFWLDGKILDRDGAEFLSTEYFRGWIGEWILVVITLFALLGLGLLLFAVGKLQRGWEEKEKSE